MRRKFIRDRAGKVIGSESRVRDRTEIHDATGRYVGKIRDDGRGWSRDGRYMGKNWNAGFLLDAEEEDSRESSSDYSYDDSREDSNNRTMSVSDIAQSVTALLWLSLIAGIVFIVLYVASLVIRAVEMIKEASVEVWVKTSAVAEKSWGWVFSNSEVVIAAISGCLLLAFVGCLVYSCVCAPTIDPKFENRDPDQC